MLAVTFQNPELIGQNYQTLVELFSRVFQDDITFANVMQEQDNSRFN